MIRKIGKMQRFACIYEWMYGIVKAKKQYFCGNTVFCYTRRIQNKMRRYEYGKSRIESE